MATKRKQGDDPPGNKVYFGGQCSFCTNLVGAGGMAMKARASSKGYENRGWHGPTLPLFVKGDMVYACKRHACRLSDLASTPP